MAVAPLASSGPPDITGSLPVGGLRPSAPLRVEVQPGAPTATQAKDPSRLKAIVELGKPGITRLVTITAIGAYALAAVGRPWDQWSWDSLLATLAGCIVGTALSSAGANAINQWMERHRDALMRRTSRRPLPQRRLTGREALGAGIAMSVAGVGLLAWLCGPAAATVSLVTILFYVLLYTPAKVLTPLNTILGAVPGALPPLIGWCAALHPQLGWANSFTALAEPAGWSLFALMFVWQIPHFLALAWMYREDYALGGYQMLPLVDPDGSMTARTMLGWAIMLVPASLLPVVVLSGRVNWPYAAIATLTGALFMIAVMNFVYSRTVPNARRVFFGSILHLPILMAALVGEAVVRWLLRGA